MPARYETHRHRGPDCHECTEPSGAYGVYPAVYPKETPERKNRISASAAGRNPEADVWNHGLPGADHAGGTNYCRLLSWQCRYSSQGNGKERQRKDGKGAGKVCEGCTGKK